jgi:hypothetical protein
VPAGPFNVAQIHAKLAAGDVTWQTLACPVGGSTWLPLVKVPGIGPVQPPPPESAPNPAPVDAGPAHPEVMPQAVATAKRGGPDERPSVAAQKRTEPTANVPFRFRSGGEARTLGELVTLCEAHREDAEQHLMSGDLERWLRDSGQEQLARRAEKARTSGWLARKALTYHLKQCGESDRTLASRIETDDAVRRQKAEEESRRRAEADGSPPGCPKCGFKYVWRDGRCDHCGYSGGAGSTDPSPAKPL